MDGLHPVKHGLRFGAETLEIVTPDLDAALRLAAELAPDIRPQLAARLTQVAPDDFRRLSPVPPDTGIIAIARRPTVCPDALTAAASDAPLALLENPRSPFNIGAAIRVGRRRRRRRSAGHRPPGSLAPRGHRRRRRTAIRPPRRPAPTPCPVHPARSSPSPPRANPCPGPTSPPAPSWLSARNAAD